MMAIGPMLHASYGHITEVEATNWTWAVCIDIVD